METYRPLLLTASAAVVSLGLLGAASAQPAPDAGPALTVDDLTVERGAPSEARGAPVSDAPSDIVGPIFGGGFAPPGAEPQAPIFGARDGGVPEGVEPLDHDIFTTEDFYADRDLWTDPRYYRCIAPEAMELLWQPTFQRQGAGTNPAIGENPPETIAWGRCDVDYPREAIVSPYPFETAQAHYEALLAEVEARGGPTVHTAADLPDWNGVYRREGFGTSGSGGGREPIWHWGNTTQASTYMSLLTPEYQTRFVQQEYHYAQNQPQYPGSYCWPEGFTRRWFPPSVRVLMVPDLVQVWTNISEQLTTHIYVGREFNMDGSVPNLLGDVRQWFGDTIGFWDGDVLITWTSNIKGWYSHGWYEYSDEMQSIEIYSPITGPDGSFVGVEHEAILYDPVALVEPIRIINYWQRQGSLAESSAFDWRECIQTIFPIEGLPLPVNPGDTIEYTVPDMNNRPWAQIWEQYFEEGMQRPEEEDVLSNF